MIFLKWKKSEKTFSDFVEMCDLPATPVQNKVVSCESWSREGLSGFTVANPDDCENNLSYNKTYNRVSRGKILRARFKKTSI